MPAWLPSVLLWAAGLHLVVGHICLLNPRQRGKLNVSTPGDDSCYRRTSYCGAVPLASPLTTFAAGETISLSLQQNLNHFFPARPGFLDVAVSYALDPSESDWISLASWPDAPAFDMVSQTTFSIPVTLPAKSSAHALLRARYTSYNPLEIDPPVNTDAVFYNCADITLVAVAAARADMGPASPAAAAAAPAVPAGAYACSTPPSWHAEATETNQVRGDQGLSPLVWLVGLTVVSVVRTVWLCRAHDLVGRAAQPDALGPVRRPGCLGGVVLHQPDQ